VSGYRLYEASTGQPLCKAGGYFGPVVHLAFATDGKTLWYETNNIKALSGK